MRRAQNLLDLIPRRAVPHRTEAEGRVTLLVPRFKNRLLQRLFAARRPTVELHLDALGSFVWSSMEQDTEVGAIAQALLQNLGPEAPQIPERVATFCKTLHQNGFIRLDAC